MAGRPTTYTKELNQKAKDYLTDYLDVYEHPLPSIVGMAVVLNVPKSTLYQWAEDKRGDISDTLAQCNDFQELALVHKGLTNTFNPTIVKLALANHGYSDKVDNTLSAPGGGPVQTRSTVLAAEMTNEEASGLYRDLIG